MSYKLQVMEVGVDISKLKEPWMNKVKEIFAEATLTIPGKNIDANRRQGRKT